MRYIFEAVPKLPVGEASFLCGTEQTPPAAVPARRRGVVCNVVSGGFRGGFQRLAEG
jgi:hypothetical protein